MSSLPQVFCPGKVKICEIDVYQTEYFDTIINELISSQKITQKVANCLIDKAIEKSKDLPKFAELIVFPAKDVRVKTMFVGTKSVPNKNQAPDASSIEKLKKTLEEMRDNCNARNEYPYLNKLEQKAYQGARGYNRSIFSTYDERRWQDSKRIAGTPPFLSPSENQDKLTKIENLLKKLEPSPNAK